MSPLIMYMTSSLGSLWNSLRNSRPRATNAMLSGACQRTVFGRPDALMLVMTCPRLTAFISSMRSSPERAELAEALDLLVIQAERVAQHGIRVLSEQRRGRTDAARRVGQAHRRRD